MKAYAKINLALEVMDKDDSGYHKVNNIMIPIDLYDEIEIFKDPNYSSNSGIIEDICVKAIKMFVSYYKIEGGARIEITKNIPMGGGLAGGSTDAAMTLNLLYDLYGIEKKEEEIMALAARLGSDVPFFIKSKPALCTGRGEIVNELESNLDMNILIINPGINISTKEIYSLYKYEGESKEERINNIISGLKNNDAKLIEENVFNDLADYSLYVNKEYRNLFSDIKDHGINVKVSGSGSSMYVINPTEEEIEFINGLNPKFVKLVKAL